MNVNVGDTVIWTLQSTSDTATAQTTVILHSSWGGAWPTEPSFSNIILSQAGTHTYTHVVTTNVTHNGQGCQYDGNFSGMQGNLNVNWFTSVNTISTANSFSVLNNPVTGNNISVSLSLQKKWRN